MDPLAYVPIVLVLVLAPLAALGRWFALNSETRTRTRTRTRASREQPQAS